MTLEYQSVLFVGGPLDGKNLICRVPLSGTVRVPEVGPFEPLMAAELPPMQVFQHNYELRYVRIVAGIVDVPVYVIDTLRDSESALPLILDRYEKMKKEGIGRARHFVGWEYSEGGNP